MRHGVLRTPVFSVMGKIVRTDTSLAVSGGRRQAAGAVRLLREAGRAGQSKESDGYLFLLAVDKF